MPSASPTTMQPVTPRWRMSDARSAVNGLLMVFSCAPSHPAACALERPFQQAPDISERDGPRRRDEQDATAARRHRHARGLRLEDDLVPAAAAEMAHGAVRVFAP